VTAICVGCTKCSVGSARSTRPEKQSQMRVMSYTPVETVRKATAKYFLRIPRSLRFDRAIRTMVILTNFFFQFLSTTRPITLPERNSSIHFWTSLIGSSLIGAGLTLPERASAINSCASARVPTMKPSMVIRL
jgi:hypothetical protein